MTESTTVSPKGTPRASPDIKPKTMTVEEAGRALGISRATAYKCAANGEIPTIRIGRLLRVSVAALEKLLAEATKPTPYNRQAPPKVETAA